jgi:hypothetical protein
MRFLFGFEKCFLLARVGVAFGVFGDAPGLLFGAPDSVPAGKQAASTSKAVADQLEEEGLILRTGVTAQRVRAGGAGRIVELSDGSEAPERITAYDRPAHFAYRVGPFTGALRRLVLEADGGWWFSSGVSGTEIRWNYTFRPRPHTAGLVRLVIAPLWRRYARKALGLAVRIAEGQPSAAG